MIYPEYIVYPLFLITIILSVYAQIKVSSTFKKYSKAPTLAGKTAGEIAREMLLSAGVFDVSVTLVGGHLSDHYDPRSRTLRLSKSVFYSSSAAAVGVAAHEAGHAIQHAEGYFPLKLRSAIVPAASFSSRFAFIAIMLGCVLMAFAGGGVLGYYLLLGGTGLFAVTTAFQLITLPCEFNASARALRFMRTCGYYTDSEIAASKKVLSAAALTYIAAALASAVQLLRLLIILNSGRRRR